VGGAKTTGIFICRYDSFLGQELLF